jgi:hypothetical protein
MTDAWRQHPMFNAQENLKRMFPGLGTGVCLHVRSGRASSCLRAQIALGHLKQDLCCWWTGASCLCDAPSLAASQLSITAG